MSDYPTLKQIQEAKEKLRSLIVETPAHPWHDPWLSDRIGHNTEVFVKLELLQVTGTFKPRGALNVMFNLDKSQLNRGVTMSALAIMPLPQHMPQRFSEPPSK